MDKIKGQAVHKRNISNKAMFVDVIKTEDQSRISVLFKKAENICDQSVIDRLKRGKEKLHLGDLVEIHGSLDQDVFVATQYKIITRWSISNPDKSFESQPPTMKKSAKVIFLLN
jgi:lysyl-tRNA synthetase class II